MSTSTVLRERAHAAASSLRVPNYRLYFVGQSVSAAGTFMQLAARPEMRGRVMALWALAWGGSTAIGAPIVGWIADAFGSRWGLVAGGLPTVVLGLALLPALRRQDARVS